MPVYLALFLEFFQIGLFAVGGGPATIPFLMDLPSRYDWYEVGDVTNMLAVSESTPGPIGINMATYAGYKAAGFPGGIIATFSLVLPSLIVIILVAKILDKFNSSLGVKACFNMIRPAVTGLIATAVWGIISTTLFIDSEGVWHFPIIPVFVTIAYFVLMNLRKLKKLHPAFWILCGAVMGIIFRM